MKHIVLPLAILVAAAGCDTKSKPGSGTAKTDRTADTDRTSDRETTTTTTTTTDTDADAPKDADNTAVNVRDRESTTRTPIDQNENQQDINITAEIRKQIVDTEMSVNAKNVKVVTQNGKVTLRGPVKSEEEKNRIEEIAVAVAGADKVTNELEVEASP